MSAVKHSTGNTHSERCRLHEGILFGMNATTDLDAFGWPDAKLLTNTTDLFTMGQAMGSTIVTGAEDSLVPYENCTHLSAQAGGTLAHESGDVEEVAVPGLAFH